MFERRSMDEKVCKRMNRRYRELAGMYKEVGKGSYNQFHQIASKFAAQVGVRRSTAKEYAETLIEIGLVTMKEGSGDWQYNEDAEWELFSINI